MSDYVLQQCDYRELLGAVAAAGGCDLVLTSPPYDDARTYGAAVSWAMDDYRVLGDAVFAALAPGGHCLMVLDGPVREWRKGFGTERSFTPWRVMLDWAERVGFRVPDRLAYGRHGVPGAYYGRFRNDWEPLLWFQRPGARGCFDRWPLVEKAKYDGRGGTGGNRTRAGDIETRRRSGRAVEEGVRHRGTYWNYGSVGSGRDPIGEATDHPARFFLPFAEDAVHCFCRPDGLVVDPFVGSGTSLVAAVRHGRRFVGGDALVRPVDGRPWVDVAEARLLADCARRKEESAT